MKILHIDSSIMGSNSITRRLSSTIVAHLQDSHRETHVEYRDLVDDELKHLTGPIAAGFRQTEINDFTETTLQEHQLSETLVMEFLASDVLVIGAPMYNFNVSSQLKAWLDRIAQVGRTFKYTEQGPVGLSGGKRVIVVSARGGFYSEGPLQKMDFQESYLRAFFGFLGISDIHFVRAEGVSRGQQLRDQGVEKAIAAMPAVIASLSAPAQ
ncbi:FMN-dependent NADH-azoreductase [Pseudomonas sp. R11F]|uniref:FMN dependent NADH:quinone oxidoreductase n=1 Tax=Pseudomonas palleroniana TaxID=191390 RepID=A0A2L1J8M9_9PSED|nr:FMN-dependent NADH-azoreductase [Pseudomonas palleroniana]AVE04806.1 FMN-dependent NADH-azoreductase [Pseudomonas palleroniana]UOK40479.1 FMN-dependent NADH-azoreductase [Pseudomonas palleroniana]UOP11293.1 FMN-dependent NADH-azoreductase [Pseudomonas palleroniana]